jgi:DNA-binding transcriptional LysR family regulator
MLPAGELRGLLRVVAAPLTFGPTHFAEVLSQMALRHSHLHIHTGYSDRLVGLIAEGHGCAIRVKRFRTQSLGLDALALSTGVVAGQETPAAQWHSCTRFDNP